MRELPRRKPHPHRSGAWGQHGRRDSESTVEEHRRRTSPQSPQCGPPLVPALPGTAGGTNTARSLGKRRLYIISRRAAGAPARPGDGAAAPARSGAGAACRAGDQAGRQGLAGACSAAPTRGWRVRAEGGLRAPGRPGPLPRRAGRAMRRAAGAGRAQAGVPALPAGCRRRARPARLRPGPPRAHLSRALPEWLCGTAS